MSLIVNDICGTRLASFLSITEFSQLMHFCSPITDNAVRPNPSDRLLYQSFGISCFWELGNIELLSKCLLIRGYNLSYNISPWLFPAYHVISSLCVIVSSDSQKTQSPWTLK